jgi:integrase
MYGPLGDQMPAAVVLAGLQARLVRVHMVPALGRAKLRALSPAHLQGFYRAKLDAGLSPRTVQYLHVVLHRALKQALRWGLVPRNVSEAVDPPRVPRKEIKPLSPGQARTLLETTGSKPSTCSPFIAV